MPGRPPPPSLDPPAPKRAGKAVRPTPPLTGVTALLAGQRGQVELAYRCAEGRVLLEYGWPVSLDEQEAAAEVADAFADAPGVELVGALVELFRCSLTYRLAVTQEGAA